MIYGWEMLIASVVGFVGGYAGVAGAPLIIFFLTYFLGYSQHSAQGVVLAMMLGPMTILPVIFGWDIVCRRIKAILTAIVIFMIFSFCGAEIAYLFDSPTLQLMFGIFIGLLGIFYIIFTLKKVDQEYVADKEIPLKYMVLIGVIMGVVSGITGIGSGILLIPFLTIWLGIDYREAQIMSLAILLPPVSLGAVSKYGLIERDILWHAAGLMFISYVIMAGLGYKLSLRHGTQVLQIVLSFLLIIAGAIDVISVIRV